MTNLARSATGPAPPQPGRRAGEKVSRQQEQYRAAYITSRLYVYQVQTDPKAEVSLDLLHEARENGWHDVVFAIHHAQALQLRQRGQDFLGVVAAMREAAEESGDAFLAAKGIACGVEFAPSDDIDQELAHAVALLEIGSGAYVHRSGAFIMCGHAYRKAQLWPLVEEMNRKSLESLTKHPQRWCVEVERTGRFVSQINILAALMSQACEVFEVGDFNSVAEIAGRRDDLHHRIAIPSRRWAYEVRAEVDLLEALNGQAPSGRTASEAEVLTALGPTRTLGCLRLARAVRLFLAGHIEPAAAVAETALPCVTGDSLDPRVERTESMYSLALSLAALGAPSTARSLRYGREMAIHRRHTRQRDVKSAMVRRRIEEIMMINRTLTTMAYTDSLTGLTNRCGFDDYRQRLVREIATPEAQIGVLLIDVNRFKVVNDEFGHSVGDQVLIAIADAMRASVRGTDLAARLGGDEFIVLLPTAADTVTRERAWALSCRIAEIDWPAISPGLSVSASIGCAAGLLTDLDALLVAADEDMYQLKKAAAEPLSGDTAPRVDVNGRPGRAGLGPGQQAHDRDRHRRDGLGDADVLGGGYLP